MKVAHEASCADTYINSFKVTWMDLLVFTTLNLCASLSNSFALARDFVLVFTLLFLYCFWNNKLNDYSLLFWNKQIIPFQRIK